MQRILFLLSSLDYHGAARQLALLVRGLARDEFERCVCVLGAEGPLGEPLRQAGASVTVLNWTRRLDVAPFLRLKRLIREFQPDLIHAWGLPPLRLLSLVREARSIPLAVSAPGPGPQRKARSALSLWDSQALRRAAWASATGPHEVARWRQLGVPQHKITIVPPAVNVSDTTAASSLPAAIAGLPADARIIVCIGPLEVGKDYRDALWTLDILKYLYDDLHLLIVGDGPERERLEKFGADIRVLDRVHFLGYQADVAPWLARAAVVWVTSRVERGHNVILEAMASGRPVVASRLPGFAALVEERQTGFLVPAADKVARARQTRLLLDDAGLRQRLGVAARQRATERYAAAAVGEQFRLLYGNDRSQVNLG